jgi:thiol:disulfide interchange protein DsbD
MPSGELTWILNDYNAAVAQAKAQNKPIFIDFTGYTCTNCRWMEANIFPKPEVRARLDKFIRVRLYTDGDGEIYDKQQQMEKDRFGTVALPLYAIMSPADSPVATFPGLTRKVDEFTGFLAKGDGVVAP